MRIVTMTFVVLGFATSSVGLADDKPAEKPPLKFDDEWSALVFSPDGKTLVVGERNRGGMGSAAKVHIYDYDGKSTKRKHSITVQRVIMDGEGFRQLGGSVAGLAVSPDGKTLAILNRFCEIQLHDLASGNRSGTIQFPNGLDRRLRFGLGFEGSLHYSPDGKRLAFLAPGVGLNLNQGVGTCALFEIEQGKHIKTIGGVRAVVSAKDGRFLAVQTHKSKKDPPNILDLSSAKSVGKLELKEPLVAFQAAFLIDGRLVALSASRRAVVWDVRTGKQKRMIGDGKRELFECGLTFSPDGRFLVAGTIDVTNGLVFRIQAVQVADGKVVWEDEDIQKRIRVLGVSPDGKAAMYHVSGENQIRFWTFPKGRRKANDAGKGAR